MMDTRAQGAAMISAIETARGHRVSRPSTRIFVLLLMGVFFVALMGGLAIGASVYRAVVWDQQRANDLHLQAGLVTNAIRAGDTSGAVRVGDGPEGDALVIVRHLPIGDFENRLYLYEGHLMQESAVAAGRPYDPQSALELLQTSYFAFQVEGSLLTFTTDLGSFSVALRADPVVRAAYEGEAEAHAASADATQLYGTQTSGADRLTGVALYAGGREAVVRAPSGVVRSEGRGAMRSGGWLTDVAWRVGEASTSEGGVA